MIMSLIRIIFNFRLCPEKYRDTVTVLPTLSPVGQANTTGIDYQVPGIQMPNCDFLDFIFIVLCVADVDWASQMVRYPSQQNILLVLGRFWVGVPVWPLDFFPCLLPIQHFIAFCVFGDTSYCQPYLIFYLKIELLFYNVVS